MTSEHVAQRTIDDCRAVLRSYQEKSTKYQNSLGTGQSSSLIRDTFQKLRWAFTMKRKMNEFRLSIAQHVAALNIQLPLQHMWVSRVPLNRVRFLSHVGGISQLISRKSIVTIAYCSTDSMIIVIALRLFAEI